MNSFGIYVIGTRNTLIGCALIMLSGCAFPVWKVHAENVPISDTGVIVIDGRRYINGQFMLINKIDNIDGYSKAIEVLPGEHKLEYICWINSRNDHVIRFAPIKVRAGFRYDIYPSDYQCNLLIMESLRDPKNDLNHDPSNPVIEKYSSRAFTSYSQIQSDAFVTFQTFTDNSKRIAERNAELKAEADRTRVARELPMLTKIGTRICRDQESFVYVGFVENVSGEKIQIRVADAYVRGAMNFRPGGFSPEIIWDFPNNWHLCE